MITFSPRVVCFLVNEQVRFIHVLIVTLITRKFEIARVVGFLVQKSRFMVTVQGRTVSMLLVTDPNTLVHKHFPTSWLRALVFERYIICMCSLHVLV